jgi:2,5-diamino-6-(ribosylamino)-4(3H)-pyrimidinone 5'-phosphate reductase
MRPFVLLNMAMTADGKIPPANRQLASFGSPNDQAHLLRLRATADAVMCGARTLAADAINLGPGPAAYRRLRVRRGLSEYNLRIVVSGSGSIGPDAEVFRHRFSPIIVLASQRIAAQKRRALEAVADEVKVCGETGIDFAAALRWLHDRWRVRRLLCEGGGELNGALFAADLVDELHLTLCPIIIGGRHAPTIADGAGIPCLSQAIALKLHSRRRIGSELFLVYRRSSSLRSAIPLKKRNPLRT